MTPKYNLKTRESRKINKKEEVFRIMALNSLALQGCYQKRLQS